MGKTPHPTPHTPHPAPTKNFLPQTYLFSGTFANFSRPQALSEEFISLEEIP
ncbi:hypothetical protein [Microcystis sp.]|uniref:hypothetical protein n=1 Tax=Microcystis sp. TaxID=1127 RepID=UPI00391B7673